MTIFCTYGWVKVTTKMYGGYEVVLGGVDIANLPWPIANASFTLALAGQPTFADSLPTCPSRHNTE